MGKLLQELEGGALAVFPAPSDRDRVKSVLADLAKTASDFRIIASKGLDLVSNGILPRLRCAHAPCAPFVSPLPTMLHHVQLWLPVPALIA